MAKYVATIDFYKNSNLSFDIYDEEARGEYASKADFVKAIQRHCKAWGYDYKIKEVKRVEE